MISHERQYTRCRKPIAVRIELTTPLDPDSGPRSSQTNTEPGRMKSRRSVFVSRLVIRGKALRATASKMM